MNFTQIFKNMKHLTIGTIFGTALTCIGLSDYMMFPLVGLVIGVIWILLPFGEPKNKENIFYNLAFGFFGGAFLTAATLGKVTHAIGFSIILLIVFYLFKRHDKN